MAQLNPFSRRFVRFTLLAILTTTSMAHAKTHYVEKWGLDYLACTKTSPCLTIQHAIDLARKNDKIIVGPGIYDENIIIDSNINGDPLDGLKLESTAGRYATVIAAALVGAPVISIVQPKVQIGKKGKGFTVEGATTSIGIHVETDEATRCKIEGNRVTANETGIRVNTERLQFRYNIVNDNVENGFLCFNCDLSVVSDNRIESNGSAGIRIASDRVSILRNVISGNAGSGVAYQDDYQFGKVVDNVAERSQGRAGFDIDEHDGMLVQANIAARNGDDPFDHGFSLKQYAFTKAAVVKNNLSVGNRGLGFDVDDMPNAKIESNSAIQNGVQGIFLEDTTTVATLKNNNTFANLGGFGCDLENSTAAPIVYSRHFFGGPTNVGACGDLSGTVVSKPSALKVNRAKAL